MGLGAAITVDGQTDVELAEAAAVEVYEQIGEPATFALHYPVSIEEADLPRLIDSRLDPGKEIAIYVPVASGAECLIKGPVHAQQIHFEHGGAGSTVAVIGSDSSIMMDRETRTVQWADVTDDAAVSTILGNYSYTPDLESTNGSHSEAQHTLIQRDSDLRFVRRLAARNGFFFWVTCDANGVEAAHFKRIVLDGEPAAKLVINIDPPNLQSLDISWDVERPTSVIGAQLDLGTLENIDGAVPQTPLTILGTQSLSAIASDTRSVHILAPADDAGALQARGEGALVESDWFIRATCTTSLHELGGLVRSHTVVELQGVGTRYSGYYLVAAVHHRIDAAKHQMDVTLLKNGWG